MLASIGCLFSFMLKTLSLLIQWGILNWNMDTLGIILWDSISSLNLLFSWLSLALLWQGKERHWLITSEQGLEVQIPHSDSIDTQERKGFSLRLGDSGSSCSLLSLHWYLQGTKVPGYQGRLGGVGVPCYCSQLASSNTTGAGHWPHYCWSLVKVLILH